MALDSVRRVISSDEAFHVAKATVIVVIIIVNNIIIFDGSIFERTKDVQSQIRAPCDTLEETKRILLVRKRFTRSGGKDFTLIFRPLVTTLKGYLEHVCNGNSLVKRKREKDLSLVGKFVSCKNGEKKICAIISVNQRTKTPSLEIWRYVRQKNFDTHLSSSYVLVDLEKKNFFSQFFFLPFPTRYIER